MLAAATAVLAVAVGGCSSASHDPSRAPSDAQQRTGGTGDQLTRHDKVNDTYGSLPTYLPTNAVDNNAPIRGRAGSPAVTSEGDQVVASVHGVRVVAEISGPVVPGEGLPDPPEATTCTWHVRMRVTGGSLPLAAADFNSLDHLGTIYRVTGVPGQPRIPASVRPGHPASFELRAVMPTGEGVMRWSPDRRTILGEWDFTVEND